MKKSVLFVSSVQKELQEERRAIHDFIQGDPLCNRYFKVFLFEDLPATDRRADDVYLEEVDRCKIYVPVGSSLAIKHFIGERVYLLLVTGAYFINLIIINKAPSSIPTSSTGWVWVGRKLKKERID